MTLIERQLLEAIASSQAFLLRLDGSMLAMAQRKDLMQTLLTAKAEWDRTSPDLPK